MGERKTTSGQAAVLCKLKESFLYKGCASSAAGLAGLRVKNSFPGSWITAEERVENDERCALTLDTDTGGFLYRGGTIARVSSRCTDMGRNNFPRRVR